MSVSCRSSLHFSNSCSLVAPHKEQVWLTVGNMVECDQQEGEQPELPSSICVSLPFWPPSTELLHDGLPHTPLPPQPMFPLSLQLSSIQHRSSLGICQLCDSTSSKEPLLEASMTFVKLATLLSSCLPASGLSLPFMAGQSPKTSFHPTAFFMPCFLPTVKI